MQTRRPQSGSLNVRLSHLFIISYSWLDFFFPPWPMLSQCPGIHFEVGEAASWASLTIQWNFFFFSFFLNIFPMTWENFHPQLLLIMCVFTPWPLGTESQGAVLKWDTPSQVKELFTFADAQISHQKHNKQQTRTYPMRRGAVKSFVMTLISTTTTAVVTLKPLWRAKYLHFGGRSLRFRGHSGNPKCEQKQRRRARWWWGVPGRGEWNGIVSYSCQCVLKHFVHSRGFQLGRSVMRYALHPVFVIFPSVYRYPCH